MKITDVKIFETQGEHGNWLFVKLYTNTGLTGVGECSIERHHKEVVAGLESMKDFLVGKDPFQIEHIWNSLYKQTFWYGQLVTLCALSGVEQALWDIKGKELAVPVYELLGGKLRGSVRAYANAWAFQQSVTEHSSDDTPETIARAAEAMVAAGFTGMKWDPFRGGKLRGSVRAYANAWAFQQSVTEHSSDDTPETIARAAEAMVAAGFTGMKWDPFRFGGQVISKEEEKFAIASVKAVREAVGPDVDLMIECHGRFNMWSAIRMAQKLEPFDPFFYEEPIPPDNVDAMAEVQRSINLPVATGERLYTRWEFRPLFEKQAARIIQPDICHAGGILELKKIAAMAEAYYISVQPHNSNGPIGTIASLHVDASIPNFIIQEFFYPYLDHYNEILTEPIEYADGYLKIPDRPGLGTDINEEAILKRPPIDTPPEASWIGSYW